MDRGRGAAGCITACTCNVRNSTPHTCCGICFDLCTLPWHPPCPAPCPQVCRRRACARTGRRVAVARFFDEAAAEGPEEEEEAAPAAAHAKDVKQLLGAGEDAGVPSQSVGSCSSDEPAGDEGESAGESEQEEEEETEEAGDEDDFLKDKSR